MEIAQISNIITLFNSSWKMTYESKVCVGKAGSEDYLFTVSHEPENFLHTEKHIKYTYNGIRISN